MNGASEPATRRRASWSRDRSHWRGSTARPLRARAVPARSGTDPTSTTRFDGLLAWELELRAKSAELALADTTRRALLDRFAADCSDDPALPHSYANALVVASIRGTGDASRAARAALAADSAWRLRKVDVVEPPA